MFNEESLELMTIDLLKEQGYSYESGESIGRDYSEVILEYNLTCALFKINKGLNENIIAEAVRIMKDLGQNNLIKYLVNIFILELVCLSIQRKV